MSPTICASAGLLAHHSKERTTDITDASVNGFATVSESNPRENQIGGDHYRTMAIQPADFIMANKLGWAEGCAIAYITRWREKGGLQDLRKAIHTLELLIDHESKT